MNIALFTDCYTPIKNGVVTSVVQLKEGLEEKGHNVVVITVEVPNYDERDKNVFRLPSVKAGMGSEQRFAFFNQGAINRLLRMREIELVHSHTEFSVGLSAKWAAKKLKIPHIHTTHTMWEDYRHYILNGKLLTSNMTRRILKTFLKNVYAIVAPSIKAKDYYKVLTPSIPIQIVNNGINVEKFKVSNITENELTHLRKQFGLKKKDKILIFVGRLGKEKRVMELLMTIGKLIKKRPNVKMLFVGNGPDYDVLIDKTKEIGLEKEIIFTGFVNWELVYRLYSIANIFITASLSEVQPMTLIESAMCGLALIVRKDLSYMDLVKDGVNGFLVDNDEDISVKVEELLDDPNLLKMFSNASLNISRLFTDKEHVNNMEKFYYKVLNTFPDKLLINN